MRIKRLEVVGFKSFCDRALVNFDVPITGVVGPNGCGKSNIVDAIRWCMGEQSAKHLRGKAMDDVIFAGSDSRGPLGMCEVSLVFENDGHVPVEYMAYSEIAITRKLYRDGTSEYFLNKTACRLRDITDFFLGTGIGAKAYSIIEQGRVGMIVSSKAEDRRFLIEEAAGITKYKVKKRAAEKKMEATRQNLLRVSDIVGELEKQLASLKRQAQKAERYRQYKAELKDLDLWGASQRWLGHVAEEAVIRTALQAQKARREAVEHQLEVGETELESLRLQAALDEEQLNGLQQTLYETDNRIKLNEAEAEHARREQQAILQRAAAAVDEIRLIDAQLAEDEQRLETVQSERSALEAESANQVDVVMQREDDWRQAREAMAAHQRRSEEVRAELGGIKADIGRQEGMLRSAERRRDELQSRCGRLSDEDSQIQMREEELRVELSQLSATHAELSEQQQQLQIERAQIESRLATLKVEIAARTPELDRLVGELHRRSSRRHSLDELHARYEGFDRGTRSMMQHLANNATPEQSGLATRWGFRGTLADALEVPAEFEAAVEAALAERLGALLVESPEAGLDAIEHLRAKLEGRATFFPVNRYGDVAASTQLPSNAEPGVLGALRQFIRTDAELDGLMNYLFGDVVVVDDLLTAVDLWRGGTRCTYVTLSGEVLDRGGSLTGGSTETVGSSVLSQKREIRELDGIIAELDGKRVALDKLQHCEKEEQQELGRRFEELRQALHQTELRLLTFDKDTAKLREEIERNRHRAQRLSTEQSELEHAATESAREAEESALQLRAARDRLVQLEDRLSQRSHEQLALLEAVERASEAMTALRVEVAQAAEKRAGLLNSASRLQSEHQARSQRRQRLDAAMAEDSERQRRLADTTATRAAELEGLLTARIQTAEELTVHRADYEQRRQMRSERESELRGCRSELEAALRAVSELELRCQSVLAARSHLEETVAERYRLLLSSVVCDFHLRPLYGDGEERRGKELRELIERMGEINLSAIEEHNTLDARYQFLVGQKNDLEHALAQLEEAIDRINRTSRKRFREVFDLVNSKFQEIFPRCFRGGQARLLLTDEDNLLESGIEIVAQPPGKKNSTVEMLSGGEKAMTAVALIFAIFLIKPSPFCLLDEVDAPLDDANVGRFNDLIREMTDRTQFIVITHNKRTMQIVDTLYGVTMEEPGISKLVSVNLSQLGRGAPPAGQSREAAA